MFSQSIGAVLLSPNCARLPTAGQAGRRISIIAPRSEHTSGPVRSIALTLFAARWLSGNGGTLPLSLLQSEGGKLCYKSYSLSRLPRFRRRYCFLCGPVHGGIATLPCFTCKGERAIPTEQAEWIRQGEAIRTDRVREHCGGRERARMLGLTPLQLNDVEHGKVDPAAILT